MDMRTIDRGTNWGRKMRNYGVVALCLGVAWVVLQSTIG